MLVIRRHAMMLRLMHVARVHWESVLLNEALLHPVLLVCLPASVNRHGGSYGSFWAGGRGLA